MYKVLFNTDCEGPTVGNDHALEVAAHWLPDGHRLFRQLSNFDDFVAYVRRRPFYNSGDTLRLLLPFLKGIGQLTDGELEAWTREPPKIQWITGAVDAIKHLLVTENVEVFEISASYYPFAALVAEKLGVRPDRVYSTYFSFDRYFMAPSEASRLRELAAEIVMLPDVPAIKLKPSVPDFDQLPAKDQAVLSRLEEIVWGEMAEDLPCSRRMLREIRAMGGQEKFNAICDSLRRTELDPERTIYIGDSITDVEAFQALGEMGGVSVSFNGNPNAVETAQFCAWGDTSLINAIVAGIFRDHGRDGLRDFAEDHDRRLVPTDFADLYERLLGTNWGIKVPSAENLEALLSASDYYRRETRATAAAEMP